MDNPHNPNLIRVYLWAKTARELSLKQWLTNVLNGKTYGYSPHQPDNEGYGCSYLADIMSDTHLDDGRLKENYVGIDNLTRRGN